MGKVNVGAEVVERAIRKLQRGETNYNVAAVFVAESTKPGQDGASWYVHVTDGITEGVTVEAMVPNTYGGDRGMAIDEARIERAVERRAGHFPVETRLTELDALVWVQIDYDDAAPDKPVATV
jgi:hypothetical protein